MKPITTIDQRKLPAPRGLRIALAAVIIAALVAAFAIARLNDSEEPVANDGPAGATLEAYASAYSNGDIDAIMAFFTDESVITNHPGAGIGTGTSEVLSDLSEIRIVHEQELSDAVMPTFRVTNIAIQGSSVTWDYRWSADGLCFAGEGHRAVIEDGKILSWTWPNVHACG